MFFNSYDFAVFLPLVFIVYWFGLRKHLQLQNLFLLAASYLFYAWWDYRFLALIILSTLVDFIVARTMNATVIPLNRKLLLAVSIVVNLGMLGFFKYYNFFIDNWVSAWQTFGINLESSTLNIILPVGISFYTFQTLSYTIDVYRKKVEPTKNLVQFAAFVSFFPQLVAGPIERASHLLPQFKIKRIFNPRYALSGFYLIIWGLFKKVVVADNCAFFVNQIFDSTATYSSLELVLGAILFSFQIYGDFSGYSDIAIGVARLFGFSLMINFSFPYFSRNIAEFWRRWHISLSTWFRDYLYIPLGGSRAGKWQQIRNVCLVFLVSGFWHGANWTFIIWGAIHAILFLPLLIKQKNKLYSNGFALKLNQIPQLLTTFSLVTLAWIFFRADNIQIAYDFVVDIFSFNGNSISTFINSSKSILFSCFCFLSIAILLWFEIKAVQKNHLEVRLNSIKAIFIITVITFMGVFKNPSDFIYFQF